MKMHWMTLLSVLAVAALLLSGNAQRAATAAGPTVPQGAPPLFLPVIYRGFSCPATSANTYYQNIVYQDDQDWPVRPAYNHADKNFSLRGYILDLVDAKSLQSDVADPAELHQPPQLGTIFNPDRLTSASANIVNVYRTYIWNWGTSPDPGTRGGEDSNPPVGVVGLHTTPGEILQTPTSYYKIAQIGPTQYQAFVMYADADTIAIHYTSEDTASRGYTVHVDNICTDPVLLNLYNQLDNPGGPRYTHPYSGFHTYSYNMPYLAVGQVFGTAHDTEVRVKVVDTGGTLDPRGCWNLWHWVAPGMSGPCN